MQKTIRLTTAQALVKFLNQQYLSSDGEEIPFVKGVFHIFGHGNVLGLGQALAEDPGHLDIYQGKNEQGMAHAAIAFAKQSLRKQIFAVTTSIGPGAANLVTAAGTALANHIPVLFLPGDTFATRQPDPVLQQIEQKNGISITTNDALRPVSRYWDRIHRPEQLMSALLRAFEVLTDPESSGPVTLAIPQDVGGEAYDFPVEFFDKRVHYLDRRSATDREVEAAVQLIQESHYPVLVVGGGARYSQAGQVLQTLAKQHKIPIVETQAGKSTVSSLLPLNLGGVGVTGNAAANEVMKQADLIIGVGTRYSDFTTSSKTGFDTEHVRFLNINVSRQHAYKLNGVSLVADARTALEQIAASLDSGYQTSYGDRLTSIQDSWQTERKRLALTEFGKAEYVPEIEGHFSRDRLTEYAATLKTNLTQTSAVIAINESISEDSIVVGAAGSLPGDLQRLWEARDVNTYHMEYGYSTMGYEVAGAYGVKIANPNKEVYAFVGDGSFHMLHSELLSSLQYDKKMTILLFDNAGFGCINNLQMGSGMPSFGTEFIDTAQQLVTVDFAQLAQAYGAVGYSVGSKEELYKALQEAKQQTKSTLIHIKVLPKTMTANYLSWWNTGLAQVTQDHQTKTVLEEKTEKLNDALLY
ncbi:3D-(3,5/4)-trihydroxycyclohexane-1,2-dione acylhydrolase (decyclizing) [Streptococcus respiraculi]|uniref:3D-(3,5/4)-trihydroxycyclohexane-1,2-dione acylhydrolase (decyclizing) n=1 Tax=Streptococcus respiraculi TaxID=2021971 RepID=UPI000E75B6E6|nr:3D-(3,5/4)-trihydroxycyclohexane-1,2-dione acylhydrolase (decyclizing) [Streptococcus respiraculi]